VKPARLGQDREGVLALYPTEVAFMQLAAQGRPMRIPLASIAWVELRRSILTSHIRIIGAAEERWPSASSAPLVPLFSAIRQVIANPRTCAESRG